MKPKELPLPGWVVELAAGLIDHSVLALLREPEDARSGPEDMETLVHTVSLCDPPALDAGGDKEHHALARALAANALRELLSSSARSSAPARCRCRDGGPR